MEAPDSRRQVERGESVSLGWMSLLSGLMIVSNVIDRHLQRLGHSA